MGFYDNEVKRVCENLPRLLIKAINSIFSKSYDENSEVIYLNKEQYANPGEQPGYMDMYVEIEGSRY